MTTTRAIPLRAAERTAPTTRFWWWVALGGILLGLAAAATERMHGPLAAVLVGIASSRSTWVLGTAAVGFLATTRRRAALGAALFMGTTTSAYYLLRWILDEPWATGGVPRFLLVAAVWLIGTVAGGAVVGVLAHLIPAQPSTGNAAGAGAWLGLCLAPVAAYLPDLLSAAAGATSTDGNALAKTGAVFALINALSAALAVLVLVPLLALRADSPRRALLFVLSALLVLAASAPALRIGTALFDGVTGGAF